MNLITNISLEGATVPVSGRYCDAGNTNLGLPGVPILAESTNNFLALSFSDSRGQFQMLLTPNEWNLKPADTATSLLGYVRPLRAFRPVVNTTTGSLAGLTVIFPKATALIYGTMKDEQGAAVSGLPVYCESDQYGSYGFTDVGGNYTVGVVDGNWWVVPDDYELAAKGYWTVQWPYVPISAGRATNVNFVVQRAITTTNLPGRQLSLSYSAQLTASSGTPPSTWSVVAGNLPDGLSLNPSSGVINGTPTAVGRFEFTVRVTSADNQYAHQPLAITIHPTPPGFPIATAMTTELCFGLASDGTNLLFAILGDEESPCNVSAQLVSPTGGLLGPRIHIGRQSNAQHDRFDGPPLQASFDGTNYLLVWTDDANHPNDDIYGQFISRSGLRVGTPFSISTAPGRQLLDGFNVAFGGSNYLVTWRDEGNTNDSNICEQQAAPFGQLVGPEIVISGPAGSDFTPALAFGRTAFLIAWINRNPTASVYHVWGRFLTKSGTLGDPFRISDTASSGYNPVGVAFDGTNFLVVWNRRDEADASDPFAWDIYGRVVSESGTFVSSEFPVVIQPGHHFLSTVVWAGSGYLVTWLDGLGSSNQTVISRLWNRSGDPVGEPFVLARSQGLLTPLSGIHFDGRRLVTGTTWAVWSLGMSGGVQLLDGDVYVQFVEVLPRLVDLWTRLDFRMGVSNPASSASPGETMWSKRPQTWCRATGRRSSRPTPRLVLSCSPTPTPRPSATVSIASERGRTVKITWDGRDA